MIRGPGIDRVAGNIYRSFGPNIPEQLLEVNFDLPNPNLPLVTMTRSNLPNETFGQTMIRNHRGQIMTLPKTTEVSRNEFRGWNLRRIDHNDATEYGWGTLGVEYVTTDDASQPIAAPMGVHIHGYDLINRGSDHSSLAGWTNQGMAANNALDPTSDPDLQTYGFIDSAGAETWLQPRYLENTVGSAVQQFTRTQAAAWNRDRAYRWIGWFRMHPGSPTRWVRMVTSRWPYDGGTLVWGVFNVETGAIGEVVGPAGAFYSTLTEAVHLPDWDTGEWKCFLFRFRGPTDDHHISYLTVLDGPTGADNTYTSPANSGIEMSGLSMLSGVQLTMPARDIGQSNTSSARADQMTFIPGTLNNAAGILEVDFTSHMLPDSTATAYNASALIQDSIGVSIVTTDASGQVSATDGTNTITVPQNAHDFTRKRVRLEWEGAQMALTVNGASVAGTYDGGFGDLSNVRVFRSNYFGIVHRLAANV